MRLSNGHRFLRTPVLFRALFVLTAAHSGLPDLATGQTVRGHLFDNETRHAVVNGSVALRDTLGSLVARTGTDEDGAFVLKAPGPGTYSLLAVGMGYRSAPSGNFYVGQEDTVTMDVFLNPAPLEIPGIDVGGGTFLERLQNVQIGLDLRLARLPGESQIVTADRVRLYDTVQAKDPWKLLWRELDVPWSFNMIEGGGYEIYIDDRRTWMINLILQPNSSVCRVERYEPPPHPTVDGVPFQLRAYTCQFMAQVATGARTMRNNLNWGDLIAGPHAFIGGGSGG